MGREAAPPASAGKQIKAFSLSLGLKFWNGPRGCPARVSGQTNKGLQPLSRAEVLEWSCGREAEGGGLLNRYRVVKPYRGFESLRLRHFQALRALKCLRLSGFPALPFPEPLFDKN